MYFRGKDSVHFDALWLAEKEPSYGEFTSVFRSLKVKLQKMSDRPERILKSSFQSLHIYMLGKLWNYHLNIY